MDETLNLIESVSEGFPSYFSDHDVISGTLKIHIPPKMKPLQEGVFIPKGKFRTNEERCIGLCKR